jgi:hypothetical protein
MTWSEKVKYLKMNPVTAARMFDYRISKLFNCILDVNGIHPIGQILIYDDRREFQGSGVEHCHCLLHVHGAPRIDNDSDETCCKFIDKYITCSLPDKEKQPEMHQLVSTLQTHHHTTTCRKKKGVICRFNAPWPPTEETIISRAPPVKETEKAKHKIKRSKEIVNKVLAAFQGMDLDSVCLTQVLDEANVTATQYMTALKTMNSKMCALYKRKPNETMISPYNPILLKLWQANMNIQYVCGVYGLVIYLSEYVCKSEHYMSELMKKASKEAGNATISEQLKPVGKVFLKYREVSLHEAIKRVLSLPLRKSNVDVQFIPTGLRKDISRMLKSKEQLDRLDDDDTDIYAYNIIDKYVKRGDDLQGMCLAEFASSYTYDYNKNVDIECAENYVGGVSGHEEEEHNDENEEETKKRKKSNIKQDRKSTRQNSSHSASSRMPSSA